MVFWTISFEVSLALLSNSHAITFTYTHMHRNCSEEQFITQLKRGFLKLVIHPQNLQDVNGSENETYSYLFTSDLVY